MSKTLQLEAEYLDSYITAVTLSRRVSSFKKYIDIEIEGQVVKHDGLMKHWETNIAPVVRWLPFPWDRYLDSSFAVGGGISYASEKPAYESGGTDTPRLLGFLTSEIALALPKFPEFNVIMRFHHRSGAGGTFSKIRDASNAFGFGVRYTF